MWNGKKISIVFPAYNEEENIAEAVKEFKSLDVVDEVVVVNNNSKDKTAELAEAAGARVVKEEKQGYGYAMRRAYAEGAGDIIISAEPDGTFSAKDVYKLLAYAEDFEVVFGSRTNKLLVSEGANMFGFINFGNVVVAKLLQFLHDGPTLTDCGCSMRLIHKSAYQKIKDNLTVGQSHFLPEMVIWILKKKIRCIEIPVNYYRRKGYSKITGNFKGAWKTGINMIKLIIFYKLKFLFSR